jgi:DNA-binding NtrC family response regulator
LAFVLYVVASLGAAGVPLDLGVLAVALVACVCALAPLRVGRAESETVEADASLARGGAARFDSSLARGGAALPDGAALVGWLGMAQAIGLAGVLSLGAHGMLGELICAGALPATGLLALRLSLRVPDEPLLLRRRLPIAIAALVIAGVGGLAGAVSALPPLWIGERALIAPFGWSLWPLWSATGCAGAALGVRVFRRRLGSDAQALAANLWATLGIALGALGLAGFLLLRRKGVQGSAPHALLALAAAVLLVGHVWTLSLARVRVASAWARELAVGSLAFALVAGGLWLLGRAAPQLPQSALWLAAPLVLAFLAVRRALRPLVQRLLAPHGGALLEAIEQARRAALGASDYAELASRVLQPLRRAGKLPESAPRLLSFDPPRLAQLDAAGFARISEHTLVTTITGRLAARLGEPIVRAELEVLLPRRPELAALVKALDELDALCVVPLVGDGALVGALLIARGARRDAVTLEELLELERLAADLTPIAAGFLALERVRLRADALTQQRLQLVLRAEEQANDLNELRAQMSAVKAGLGLPLPERDPVQYSASMRAQSELLLRAAPHDVPILLCAETGLSLASVAQSIHRASGRGSEPFVILDAAELSHVHARAEEPSASTDAALARLFGVGVAAESKPGLLELIGRGTLLLIDICALSREVQHALAQLFEERRVFPQRCHASYPFEGRVIATARRPLAELVESKAITAELARWLTSTSVRIPPLRERPEDLESLLLLALDRAARVLGKPPKGVEAEALKALIQYDWPGNETELISVVERAVARAEGERIAYHDLPALPAFATFTSSGSFAEQEREILRRALVQAAGNRTDAARALGLKRGILVEKLRMLGVDDPTSVEN